MALVSTKEARYEPDRRFERPHMTAIAVIAVFLAVILLMNVVDFGRLD